MFANASLTGSKPEQYAKLLEQARGLVYAESDRIANAANLNLVTFSRYGVGDIAQVFTLFAIALTVAEVVVGLAIVVLLARSHKDTLVELASEMKL